MSAAQLISYTIKKIKEFRLSQNIISYLFCVVIASVFWLLNELNKDYSVELTYPVKYTNFPEGKFPVVQLPEELRIEVKAKGFSLLGYRLKTSFLPITCNVGSYTNALQQDREVLEFTINTNDIKDRIGAQISPDIKLLKIYPEEILFRLAVAKRRKAAVRPTLDYTLKRQYILNHVATNPDSVWVSGPASVVDTLKYIATAPLHLKELSKNTKRRLELLPPSACSLDEASAEVSIEVEQFTEARRTLPVTARHVPDSMNIRLFPSYVDISYEIGLSKYEQVTDHDFLFSVEYPKDPTINFLEVKAVRVPSFIKNLTYSPQRVEYILERK